MATEHKTSQINPININKAPQDSGVIVAWADGLVASSLGKKKIAKFFDKKAREKSIDVGMNHAMNLLGELRKNECDSYLCVHVRASKTTTKATSTKTLPPPIFGQDPPPPPCLKPHSCNEPSRDPTGHATSRHCNNCTISASLGKASNSTLGSCYYDKGTPNASPGEATNGTWGTSCHDNDPTFSKCSAKFHKAETHHH
jgi:hypothetical protein